MLLYDQPPGLCPGGCAIIAEAQRPADERQNGAGKEEQASRDVEHGGEDKATNSGDDHQRRGPSRLSNGQRAANDAH